jgi:hypothetical protein
MGVMTSGVALRSLPYRNQTNTLYDVVEYVRVVLYRFARSVGSILLRVLKKKTAYTL